MADINAPIQLSWQQVDAWEKEIAALQRKVEAAKVFLPARPKAGPLPPPLFPPPEDEDVEEVEEPINFMGAVVEIANSVSQPINKEEMRRRLRARGAPESKLGKTLDVTLYKTKKANRIYFHNGKISGAPK